MKNLKVILALTMAITFVISSCTNEEVFQNKSTTIEELSTQKSNSFIDLVKEDVYPVNLLSSSTIKAFNKSIVMIVDEIGSAEESVLKADLNEDQIDLLFDLLAERDFDRANINIDGSIELRGHCEYVTNRKILKFSFPDCYNAAGGRCKVCPEDG